MTTEPKLIECDKHTIIFSETVQLSAQMVQILRLLQGGKTVSAWQIVDAIGISTVERPDKQVAVQICKMRGRLKPIGLSIDCIVGKGYKLVRNNAS